METKIGNLKQGNTVNVGRKKSIVRMKVLKGLEKSLPWLLKVAAGEPVVEFWKDGEIHFRSADVKERTEAIKMLAQYGLGVQTEVEGEFNSKVDLGSVIAEIASQIALRSTT